jgi:hypothetical protein
MRHRETIRRKLEQIDSNMANMDLLVKRGGNVDSFLELISKTRDIVEETKSFIELEPTTPDEINIIR